MKVASILMFSLFFTDNNPIITVYGQSKQLTWGDFINVKVLKNATAETTTEISYSYEETNGKASIKIYCTFDKKQSFVVKGKQTPYLLNHEQRHFDISHFYANILYKRFTEESDLTEIRTKDIYDKTMTEWNDMQDLYDKETSHSIDSNQQNIWDFKIDNF